MDVGLTVLVAYHALLIIGCVLNVDYFVEHDSGPAPLGSLCADS
jgi:hypothetical protein